MSRWPRLRPTDSDPRAEQPTRRPEAIGDTPRIRARQPTAPQSVTPGWLTRLREPLPLIGIALVLVAFVGYLAVYSSTTHRAAVLVTTRALPAGTVLRASDLRAAELAGDGAVVSGLAPEDALGEVVGRRLQDGLPAGTPLPRTALASRGASLSSMTLAIPALHALGGELQRGDRATVIATFGAGSARAHTRVVARGLQVLSVGGPPASADMATAIVPVTVTLDDPSIATQLALAGTDAKLDVLREGGGASTARIPPAVEDDAR
jgi:Flp pilus assembly protein CpaB